MTAPASVAGFTAAASGAAGDAAIRTELRTWLPGRRHHDASAVLIEELGLCRGRARIDLALVGRTLHGFEIKSDRDSLRRLQSQSAWYNRIFDEITLVVGERLAERALRLVPSWWGVLRASRVGLSLRLDELQVPSLSPERDIRALVELLWADHALQMLERRGAARGVRGRPRRYLWERVCECFQPEEIAAEVRAHLRYGQERGLTGPRSRCDGPYQVGATLPPIPGAGLRPLRPASPCSPCSVQHP